MMTHIKITKQEMDDNLKAEKGWICNRSGNEYIYDFHLKKYPIIIKVASSIKIDTDRAKNKNSDVIKIYAVEKASTALDAKITRGLIKSSIVFSTTNWRKDLQDNMLAIMIRAKFVYDKRRR